VVISCSIGLAKYLVSGELWGLQDLQSFI